MKRLRAALLRSPHIAWRTFIKFFADNGQFLASGIAFDLLLYCIPFSLLFISALGYALGGDPTQALSVVQDVFRQFLPATHKAFTQNLSTVLDNRGLLGFLGFALLFLMSSITFGSIRISLNTVFQVRNPPGFVLGKAKDVLVMLVVTALLVLMIGLISLLALAKSFGSRFAILETLLLPGAALASTLLGFVFTFSIFYLLYRFSPRETLVRPALLVASLTGAGLFEISKAAFIWYVKLLQSNSELYGSFAGLAFFLLWIYYACVVLIVGAEVGWILQQEMRSSEAKTQN